MTIVERRKKNIEIFETTTSMNTTHPKLVESIQSSIARQAVFVAGESEPFDYFGNFMPKPNKEKAKVIVSGKRSFEAAKPYALAGKKVCVLNFADWTNPGGWVLKGSSAQEESLCRCSTLYPCLTDKKVMEGFYAPHKAMLKRDPMKILHNDDVIFTPGITVFMSDTSFPEPLPEEEWYQIDVVTCAAPRLRLKKADQKRLNATSDTLEIDEQILRNLLYSRIGMIFEAPLARDYENYDVLILGGWGCGAFRNPPELVAEAFNEQVKNFCHHFETIEFAIYHKEKETRNYEVFCKCITQP